MARNGRCKGGQGKTELENGGKRRERKMEEKEGKDEKKNVQRGKYVKGR